MSNLEALIQTVAALRGPEGCPWDREQTHDSLAECLIDECSELLETIDSGDHEHMVEELGDVLLQVVMHAQIGSEEGAFDLERVAREVNEKLIRRHPHVFGSPGEKDRLKSADAVLHRWDQIKKEEARAKSGNGRPVPEALFKQLPPQLPALRFAHQVWKQIEKSGMDAGARLDAAQVEQEGEGVSEEELGRRLFRLVVAARAEGLDPESALRRFTANLMKSYADEVQGEDANTPDG